MQIDAITNKRKWSGVLFGMSCSDKIAQELREAGLRITPQRMMVIDVIFHHPGHITAEEIYNKIQPQYPYVDLSTIYRILQVLKEQNLVAEFQTPEGSKEYESLLHRPHHHAICQTCGCEFELPDKVLEPIRQHLWDQHGFQAEMTHMAIFGRCQACLEQAHTN